MKNDVDVPERCGDPGEIAQIALDKTLVRHKPSGPAVRMGLRLEVPVNHRCRAGGESKVSGTLRATFIAGARIVATLFRVAAQRGKLQSGLAE